MSATVRRRRRTVEERIGAQLRHGKPGDLQGRGEPLKRDRGAIVSREGGPSGTDAGTDVEHLAAYATVGQTIAAGSGEAVVFDRAIGPPTERRGFRTFSARLATDGEVGAIPADLTGIRKWFAHVIFDQDYTVTVQIVRVRHGVETVLEEREGTGAEWFDGSSLDIRSGDTTSIRMDPDSEATVVWGRVFVDDFEVSDPATRRRQFRDVAYDMGPLAYWRLGESSGTTAADVMGTHDMTYQNTPTLGVAGLLEDGDTDTAVAFNDPTAADEHALGSDWADLEFDGTNPFSLFALATWTDPAADAHCIIGKKRDFGATTWSINGEGDGAGNVRFTALRADSGGGADIATSDWMADTGEYSVAASYDGSTLTLYVDGAEAANVASTRDITATGHEVKIGYVDGPGWVGKIDEPMVFGRALTANEHAELHTARKGRA